MEEEEFEEFEEATYSQSAAEAQQPSSSLPGPAHAVPDPQSSHGGHGSDSIGAPSALCPPPMGAEGLERSSPGEGESIWPQLGKTSSAHAPAEQQFMIDFSKSYSLTEPTGTPITQDFFGLGSAEQPQPATLNFLQQSPSPLLQDVHLSSPPAANNDFLMQLSPPQASFDPFRTEVANVALQDGEGKVEILQKIEVDSIGPSLYAPLISAANDFDPFTPIAQNTEMSSQEQVKAEQKEASGLLAQDDHLFEFESYETQPAIILDSTFQPPAEPQIAFSIDPVQQIVETKIEPQQENWMESYTAAPPVASYLGFEQTEPEIVEIGPEEKAEEGERKESEEFEFHQAKPAQPEVDARKQSEEFVFQTVQPPPSITEEPISTEVQHFSQPESNQFNQQQFCPAEELHPPAAQFSSNQQSQPQQEAPVQQPEEEEDEFGDFEETTQIQASEPEPNAANGYSDQENTVQINKEYLSSQEGDFYRGKQKELQQFVDGLPDYSFLFAKGFLP